MIAARYQQLVFVFFMTSLTGLVLSFVFEVQAGRHVVKDAGGFVASWLQQFLGPCVSVLPVVILVNSIAKRLLAAVIAKPNPARP